MRTFTRFTLLLLLVLAALFPIAVFAAGSLDVTATVTPEALEEAGRVEISIRLTNNSGKMLEDVTIVAKGLNETLGNFEAGVKKSYTIRRFQINEEEIGYSVPLTFTWYEDGLPNSLVYDLAIPRKTAEPAMQAERTLSSNSGAAGDVITLTYAVQNTGNVALENVTIRDPALPAAVTVGSIGVGEVKRITETITLAADVVSTPEITAVGAGIPLSVKLDPAPITLTNARLSLNVTAGAPAATGTPVTITVKNEGNVDFNSVALIDESGAALTTAFSLAQGAEKTLTVDISVAEARSLTVTATAVYGAGSGTPLIVTAQPVELIPFLSPEDVVVTLIAKPIKNKFDEPAEVTFAIRIDNDSPIALLDFELSEAQEGRLLTLGSVDQGAQTVNVKVLVSESRDVVFSAVFRDENGTSYSVAATPVAISIAEALPSATPTGEAPQGGSSWLRWLLLAIIILLLAAGASLVYVLAQGKRRKEQEREAEELDRMLAARQERHRQNTTRAPRVRPEDLEDAMIDQITGVTERPRVPVRPRAEDPAPPMRRRMPEEQPPQAPRQTTAKRPEDDLFDDEFNSK